MQGDSLLKIQVITLLTLVKVATIGLFIVKLVPFVQARMIQLLSKLYVQIKDLRDGIMDSTLRQSYDNFESTLQVKKLEDSSVFTEPCEYTKKNTTTSKWINLMDSNSKVHQVMFTDEEDNSIVKVDTPTSGKLLTFTSVSFLVNYK